MPARHSALIRRKRLGVELRRIRKEYRLTGAELAERVDWSESKVSRIETARIGLSMSDAQRFVEQLGVSGIQRENFLALAEDAANSRGWWNAYRSVITTEQRMVADVEAGAARIRTYASVMLPGLVQTSDYARQMYKWQSDLDVAAADIDAAVDIRLARQRVLAGGDPLNYQLILDESVVRRQIAPPTVIVAQIRHLIELAELPHVDIRVLPIGPAQATLPPAAHGFQLIDFRDPEDPPMVSVESLIDLRYLCEEQHITTYRVLFERMWQATRDPESTHKWLREVSAEFE